MQEDNWPADEISVRELMQAIQPQADRISPETCRRMLEKMGRNLLRFNQIESILKAVVPYAHPRGTPAGDGFDAFRLELAKETMGGAAKLFGQCLKGQDPEAFKLYLKAVVDRRNALVHNFLNQPDIAMTELGGHAAIRWLDEQHEFCEPMLNLCNELTVACLYAMERQAEQRGEELLVPEWLREHL